MFSIQFISIIFVSDFLIKINLNMMLQKAIIVLILFESIIYFKINHCLEQKQRTHSKHSVFTRVGL